MKLFCFFVRIFSAGEGVDTVIKDKLPQSLEFAFDDDNTKKANIAWDGVEEGQDYNAEPEEKSTFTFVGTATTDYESKSFTEKVSAEVTVKSSEPDDSEPDDSEPDVKDEPYFAVDNLSYTLESSNSFKLSGSVVVENTGEKEDTQTVSIAGDDEIVSEDITLNGGESDTVNFSETSTTLGAFDIELTAESDDDTVGTAVDTFSVDDETSFVDALGENFISIINVTNDINLSHNIDPYTVNRDLLINLAGYTLTQNNEIKVTAGNTLTISSEDDGAELERLKDITGDGVFEDEINFAGGSGFQDNPYKIANWYHLDKVRAFGTQTGGYHYIAPKAENTYYELVENLDTNTPGYNQFAGASANSSNGWDPIGDHANEDDSSLGNAFTGNFDGSGKKISDLNISRSAEIDVGLFGFVSDAVIENIGLENVDISGSTDVGGLVGELYSGSITDSYAEGNVTQTGSPIRTTGQKHPPYGGRTHFHLRRLPARYSP